LRGSLVFRNGGEGMGWDGDGVWMGISYPIRHLRQHKIWCILIFLSS
jgi:hypothetical protein